MKIGIIIETNDPEKAWNATRFGNTTLTQGLDSRISAESVVGSFHL